MTIDPRIAFWFGVWTSILLLVASGGISFDGALPAAYVPLITKWCAILGAINSTILTAANGYSSSRPGPLVSVPVKAVIILAVVLGALFAFPGDASAQARKPTLNLPIDPLHLNGAPITGNASADMQALWQKIVSSSLTDLNYAAAMAASANTTTSTVRLQCLKAIIQLNEQASGANLKNADGTPMAKPDPHMFTDVESLAEIVDNLSPQGPLFVNCAGAAQLAKTNVLSFVNAVVTGAAGFAAMPIIPGL